MDPLLAALATFASTLVGGLFALRFRSRLRLILSFTAGVLLGVVSFDILPEIFALATRQGFDPTAGMVALVLGFLLFHSLEKFLLVQPEPESEPQSEPGPAPEWEPESEKRPAPAAHHQPHLGVVSALALSGHSFMDGVGIGLAFQVSAPVGFAVAIAVVAHDFCDGLNTVSLMLVHRNSARRASTMLALDALAPVLGAASTLLFHVPPFVLMLYLGFFAGFLLYIGAADILPEAYSEAGSARALRLTALTTLGAAFIFVVVRLAA